MAQKLHTQKLYLFIPAITNAGVFVHLSRRGGAI